MLHGHPINAADHGGDGWGCDELKRGRDGWRECSQVLAVTSLATDDVILESRGGAEVEKNEQI